MYPPFDFVANNRQPMSLLSASLTDPDVQISRIRLFTVRFVNSTSLILTSFVVAHFLSLCTANVSHGQGLAVFRPSLLRHYPVSTVLLRNPTPMPPFGFLRLLRCTPYSYSESNMGLPSCQLHIVHHAWLFDPGLVFVYSP